MHNAQFLIKESIGVLDFVFILVNANYTEGIYLTYPPGCSHSEWSQILSITSLLSSSVCDSWFSSFSVLLGGRGFQWDIGVEILIITYINAQNFLYAIHMVQATYNLPDHCDCSISLSYISLLSGECVLCSRSRVNCCWFCIS